MGTVSRGSFAAHLRCPAPITRVKVRRVNLGTADAIIVRPSNRPAWVIADHRIDPVRLAVVIAAAEQLGVA
jgi:hypothetical protein